MSLSWCSDDRCLVIFWALHTSFFFSLFTKRKISKKLLEPAEAKRTQKHNFWFESSFRDWFSVRSVSSLYGNVHLLWTLKYKVVQKAFPTSAFSRLKSSNWIYWGSISKSVDFFLSFFFVFIWKMLTTSFTVITFCFNAIRTHYQVLAF